MVNQLTTMQKVHKTNEYKTQQETLDDLEKRKNDLENRKSFIIQLHFEGKYSDQIALPQLEKIQADIEEVNESILYVQSGVYQPKEANHNDVLVAKGNIRSLIDIYDKLDDERENKNQLLLTAIESVKLEMVKKGTRKIPDHFNLHVAFRHDFLLA